MDGAIFPIVLHGETLCRLGSSDGGGDFSLSRRTNFYFFLGVGVTFRNYENFWCEIVDDCEHVLIRVYPYTAPSLRDDDKFSDLPIAGNRRTGQSKMEGAEEEGEASEWKSSHCITRAIKLEKLKFSQRWSFNCD